jgi:hypothetical protein
MRIKFTQPAKLNGKQLIEELNVGGVVTTELPNVDIDGNFWLDVDPLDESKASAIVAAHIAIVNTDFAAAKAALLAKLGITAEEAALLLGGN